MDELVKMLRVCGDSNNSCENCPIRENDGSCPHGEWEFAAEKYMLQAADAIEELSKPRWIPVAERLPKEEKEIYWCYTNMGIMCECRWTNNRFGFGESDKWGWNIIDVPQYQKVTHWMPLPTPPKEEKT